MASAGYGNLPDRATDELLAGDPDVAAWSGIYFGSVQIDGLNLR